MDTEQELLTIRNAKVDVNAFLKLYDVYFTKVFAYTYNRLGVEEPARAVASEVFLQAISLVKAYSDANTKRLAIDIFKIADDLCKQMLKEVSPGLRSQNLDHKKMQMLTSLHELDNKQQHLIAMVFLAGIGGKTIAEMLKVDGLKYDEMVKSALSEYRLAFLDKYPDATCFGGNYDTDEIQKFFDENAAVNQGEILDKYADYKNNLKGELYDEYTSNLKQQAGIGKPMQGKFTAFVKSKGIVLLIIVLGLGVAAFTIYSALFSDPKVVVEEEDSLPTARIERFEGVIETRESADAEWQEISGVVQVNEGGSVRSANGNASIVLPGGEIVRIDSDSEIELVKITSSEDGSEGVEIANIEGSVYTRVIDVTNPITITASDLALMATDAAFRSVNYDDVLGVEVYYGNVDLSYARTNIVVSEAQMYFVTNSFDSSLVGKTTPMKTDYFAEDEFILWNRSLDKRIAGASQKMGILDDLSAPDLVILEPNDGDVVTTETIVVRGETESNAKIKVNGKNVTVTANIFTTEVALNIGENKIEVVAEDSVGNKTTLEITVIREAAPTPTAAATVAPTTMPTATPAPTNTPPVIILPTDVPVPTATP